jgi:excisionase family DNA binding protein
MSKLAYTVAEAAEAMGLGTRAVEKLIRTRKLRAVRGAGHVTIVSRVAIEEYLEAESAYMEAS